MTLFLEKNLIFTWLMILLTQILSAQTDFSSSWEDFFSYHNVKDFLVNEHNIYAIADNAAFVYDMSTGLTQKISSVNGLSGKETTSLYYSDAGQQFIIGYKSGLIEIIDNRGNITVANDIERLAVTGRKMINHITEYEGMLYLSTPFGIVTYDIENLNFADTFYIDVNSQPVFVNQTTIVGETIFAATEKGIYSADINDPNLIDSNRWLQPEGELIGSFRAIATFRNRVVTCKGRELFEIINFSELRNIDYFNSTIVSLRANDNHLCISMAKKALVMDSGWETIYQVVPNEVYDFSLTTALTKGQEIFLGTKEHGVLRQEFYSNLFRKIHPQGPQSNKVFSIAVKNSQLWVVYGGYDLAYAPQGKTLGYDHFNGTVLNENPWKNFLYDQAYPAKDLVHITFDHKDDNKVYLSSWGSGILVVENDQPTVLWDDKNSGLENLYPDGSGLKSIRINGTSFDNRGNLWVANAWVSNKIKKYDTNGNWSGYDLSSILTNPALGLNELVIDKGGSIWIGSRRNGALVFNESGSKKRALTTEATKGSLPDLNVRTLAVDRNNKVWLGTQKGLVTLNDPQGLFDSDLYDAQPVIIDDNGVPARLLGDQPVNSIAIDGADNKWFGTDTGGVIATDPSGNKTLYNFNKDNSPLPSNRILKIDVDQSTGRVFMATDHGIVAFDSKVAPYGKELDEVYAFPNPARKEHDQIIIDGRYGTGIPQGTNVKILDSSGRLVYETNVDIGQERLGGRIIWNKTNLRGAKVASGIYIVLLTSPDNSEKASTKIAVIN